MIEAESVYVIYNEVYNCNRCTKRNPECEVEQLWSSYFDAKKDNNVIKLTRRLDDSLSCVSVCSFNSSIAEKKIKQRLESKIDSFLNFLALIT